MAVQSLTNHSTEYKGSLESRAGLTVEPCSGSVKRLLSPAEDFMSTTTAEAPDVDTAPPDVIKRPTRGNDPVILETQRGRVTSASPPQVDDLTASDAASDASIPFGSELRAQLNAEVRSMLRHAFANGVEIPSSLTSAVATLDAGPDAPAASTLQALAALHAQLAKVVAPARPGTLRLLHGQAVRQRLAILGPLPNLRRLTLAAFVFVAIFVGLSTSPLIDAPTMSGELYALSGMRQLVALCFLLAAAGMGSTFQALFTAHGYAANATYDPMYDASYWVRISLGLVAGLMLAVLVPLHPPGGQGSTLEKPLVALLGGFSAGLVHQILQRLVDTVTSVFDGDPRRQQQREQDLARTDTRHAIAETRIDVAGQVVHLRDQLAQGASPQSINQMLNTLQDSLLARDKMPQTPGPRQSPGT